MKKLVGTYTRKWTTVAMLNVLVLAGILIVKIIA